MRHEFMTRLPADARIRATFDAARHAFRKAVIVSEFSPIPRPAKSRPTWTGGRCRSPFPG